LVKHDMESSSCIGSKEFEQQFGLSKSSI
jgi:hypothetical protein